MKVSLTLLLAVQIVVLLLVSASAVEKKSRKSEKKSRKSETKPDILDPKKGADMDMRPSSNTVGSLPGKCESGDCRNGKGIYAFPNGDKYDGHFKDNQPHGWGIATSTDGLLHEGDFVESARTGRGRVKYPDGGNFEGTFKDDRMHGFGSLVSPDGHHFTGEFRAGKHHGRGVYAYPSGGLYEGEYEDGARHGLGVYSFPDGLRYEGLYRQGQRHGTGVLVMPEGHTYAGEFRIGVKWSFGVYISDDGTRYEGEFADDQIEGCGILELPGKMPEDTTHEQLSEYSGHAEGRFEAGKFTGASCDGCCRSQIKKARQAAEAGNKTAQSAVIAAASARNLMRTASGEL